MGGSKGGGDTKVKTNSSANSTGRSGTEGWQDYKNILRPAEDNFMEKGR